MYCTTLCRVRRIWSTAAAPGVSLRNEVSPGEVTVLFCGRHPYQEALIVTLEGFMYGLGRGLLFWL